MPESNKNSKKILFNSVEGTGHLNACIGFAQALAKRGHEVVFVVNETIKKSVENFGFRVVALEQAKPDDNDGEKKFTFSENPAKDFAKKLEQIGLFSNKSTLEKMNSFRDNKKFMDDIINLMISFNPQIEKILKDENADCWIHDNFIMPPAVLLSKIPWICLCSASPLTYYNSPLLPPPGSGYPSNDQSQWDAFNEIREKLIEEGKINQEKINHKFGYFDSGDSNYWRSKYLNVYQFPLELEYTENGFKNPDNFVGVDTFVRKEPQKFELPEEFTSIKTDSEKMIYFSMGSMGGFDVILMKRILDILSKLPYKVIVSKGPRGDELELPANCWGKNFLPQPDIVEIVDLVITHGGNNTFTETFAAGTPMIVMPLFGDQYDNAQRLHETGYGIRINPYEFKDQELIDAINKLINDEQLLEKLQHAKKRISQSTRMEEACKRVEETIEKYSLK